MENSLCVRLCIDEEDGRLLSVVPGQTIYRNGAEAHIRIRHTLAAPYSVHICKGMRVNCAHFLGGFQPAAHNEASMGKSILSVDFNVEKAQTNEKRERTECDELCGWMVDGNSVQRLGVYVPSASRGRPTF